MEDSVSETIKFNIIIPYRPLSSGGLHSPAGEVRQRADGSWEVSSAERGFDTKFYEGGGKWGENDDLFRAIYFLNKNSLYKHNIIIATDEDVFFHSDYLSQLNMKNIGDVKVVKSGIKIIPSNVNLQIYRLNAAQLAGIQSMSDNEWLCHAYISDLVCSKNWDQPIVEAIKKHGERYTYVPMFTEVKGAYGPLTLKGVQPTAGLIWNEWRKHSCHNLFMPEPSCGYFTEDDIDRFVQEANKGSKGIIMEQPGVRDYGYYAVQVMKAHFAKRAMRMIQSTAFDLDFDNRLHTECGIMKAVITNSFVFHPWSVFQWQKTV